MQIWDPCGDFSLDSVRMIRCAIFANVLENCCMDVICYWRSRIDFFSPSTGHQILHQWRGISASVQRIYRRFLKFAYVDVCVRVGKSLLTSCERIIQKKTLNPFVLTQSGWMLYYNKIIVKKHFVQQVKSMKTQIRLLDWPGGSWLSLLKYWIAWFNGCDDRLAWLLSEYGKPSQDSLQTCK